ncbi:MAG: trehalose-phosphatase [Proteobacteria bacterium]|nr:trehalose-phosphatase [Pseudomonadota bacterium]
MSAVPYTPLPPEHTLPFELPATCALPGLDPSACAFLLDVDGTLLPFAPRPEQVRVDLPLLLLLARLYRHCAGALALVSGRSIADLDSLFAPLHLPASGLHGAELRGADGVHTGRHDEERASLRAAKPLLLQFSSQHPGVWLEDKRVALALHYRQVPHLAGLAAAVAGQLAARAAGRLVVRTGPMVLELGAVDTDKGDGVRDLMGAPPFRGRRPVYLGDDLLDEPAFVRVNSTGGLSVIVGSARASAACLRLADIAAARTWLGSLLPQAQP